MSLSAQMKQQFFKAAEAVLTDPRFQQKPVLYIEIETFKQIFSPIKRVLESDPMHDGSEIKLSRQIEELRRMCLEAQVARATKDKHTKERRTKLINTLQGLMEKVQEVENA